MNYEWYLVGGVGICSLSVYKFLFSGKLQFQPARKREEWRHANKLKSQFCIKVKLHLVMSCLVALEEKITKS